MSIPLARLLTYDHGSLVAARASLAAAGAGRNLEGICHSGRQHTMLVRIALAVAPDDSPPRSTTGPAATTATKTAAMRKSLLKNCIL